jgi:sec-independent protein translocase protein TatA
MGFGLWKLILLLAVVLVVFGPGKLPNAIKDIGKGLKALKDELGDKEDDKENMKIVSSDSEKNQK